MLFRSITTVQRILAAIQYVVKLIGQDPGDLLTVSAPQLSEDAKKAIDQLLRETRGEVR